MSNREVLNSYRGRTVLVTGHTGFKGSWLSLWLTRLGARVIGFSDAVPTSPSQFATLGLELDDRRGDICDAAAIAKIIAQTNPDIVFHFAAQSLVRKAYVDPFETYRTNVLGTLAVLDAARFGGVPTMIVATTDKVYRNDESGRRFTETDELGGSDPYSASKACVEVMTRSYRESLVGDEAMLIATVRAGNVIGGGDWAEDRLVPDLMRAAAAGETMIVRNPESTRPWQHVLDVLAGYLDIGERLLAGDATAADAWNLGPVSPAGIRVRDIVNAVRLQLPEIKVEIRADESCRRESGLLQIDSSKAMSKLSWRPRWEGEMLERTISWYREFHSSGHAISSEQLDAYEATLS